MVHLLEQLYEPFFSAANWGRVITSANDWLIILSLAIIECLLSVDNAVVLAAQTRSLDNLQDREKSLFYSPATVPQRTACFPNVILLTTFAFDTFRIRGLAATGNH